ncbi:MAG: Crp/Fnr family transcriptional regulator [Fibrobacterales bacterium]
MISKSEILQRFSLFKGLSQDDRELMANICQERRYKKKEMMFQDGAIGEYVFILVTGSVQLSKLGPEGRDVVVKVAKPGEMFAEAILFEKDNYPVSGQALKDSYLYLIPKRDFLPLLENRRFRDNFITGILQKLRFLSQQVQSTSFDVQDRLMIFLKDQFGLKPEIKHSFSKKDIATAIGTTPETISRLILKLKKEGNLIWEGKVITMSEAFIKQYQ